MKLLRVIVIFTLLAACTPRAEAQAPVGSMLRIEIENITLYIFDCPNSQIDRNPNKLDRPVSRTGIESGFAIGDIVSVNGSPVKGIAFESIYAAIGSSPNPSPGQAITDAPITGVIQWDLDFLNPNGTVIGAVRISGIAGGLPPPGAPREIATGQYIITGGTGAFFGVRGYYQPVQDPVMGERVTSACEDPSLRRTFAEGRGKRHPVLYLVPLEQPQIITTANGPAIVHANDFPLVTAQKPAKAGEILTLFASGLGPTRPGVDPGQPFTASPQQGVNSPVQVLVNGNPGDVLYAGGYPGAVDGYQVNFRVPDGTASGPASVKLTSAWIAGPEVKLPIQ